MKAKRLLSMVLILCMAVSLLPALSLTAQAANAAYSRDLYPELAILNMYTGASNKYYESTFKDKRYNAVQAGKFGSGLNYDTEEGKNRTYTWSGFADTQLALLSDTALQLKINYSTTQRNKIHDHSWWTSPFTKAKQTCYGRMTAQLWFTAGTGSSQSTNGTFYAVQYGNSSKSEFTRKGDQDYSALPEVFNGQHSIISTINGESVKNWLRSDMSLTFTNQNYKYDGGDKTCTCGGWVKNNVVTFYDGESPKVTGVVTRNKDTGAETTNFKPGDTIQVVLKFNEPVRFADNSGTGKGDVSIGLLVNGSASDPLIAKLASLTSTGYYGWSGNNRVRPTWEAVFEYTVPATTGLYDIKGIDLTAGGNNALVQSSASIAMRQVCGTSTFDVDVPNDVNGKADGFTKSSSYITDIAGNPLLNTVPAVSFAVDGQQPFVAQTVVNATLNNSGIKDRKGEGEPYGDNSDTYLGVGDSFNLTVYLNEVVDYDGKDVYNSSYIATATMNILDADDNPVTVPLKWYWDVDSGFLGTQFGLGASNGKVTKLYSPRNYTIQEGMHLPEGETDIVVQSISYDAAYNICDASGNAPRDETHDATANPPTDNLAPTMGYRLDTVGPNVTVGDPVQNGINTAFYVPFQVVDGTGPTDQTASGAAGMVGSVTLSAGPNDKSAFTYAVNGEASINDETVWHDGHLGEKLSIVESGGQQYLHVLPVDGALYDFNALTLSFYLTDYAGNGVTRTATTDVVWDNVKPTTKSGTASRVFDNVNAQGVLTVPVTIKDTCGVKEAYYLWADADEEITAASDGWTPLTISQGETTVTDDVVVYVDNGDSFSQTLWLMAEDMGGNVTVDQRNAYSYNLVALQFGLEYTTSVQEEPWIKYEMNSMVPGDGFFVVALRKANDDAVDENGNPIYWLHVGMDGGFAAGHNDDYGFLAGNFGWHKATVEEDPTTHVRTITIIDMDEDYGYGAKEGGGVLSTAHGYGLWEYNGEIEVSIYSGTMQATIDPENPTDPDTLEPNYTLKTYDSQWGTRWWYNGQTSPIIIDNSVGVEQFTLRVVHETDNWVQYADSARIQCEFTYVDPQLNALTDIGNWWSASDAFDTYGVNSTLGGMKVSFKLTDTYGWNFDGIDWENSYFRLNDYRGQQIADPENDIRVSGIQPGQAEQTIIFPDVTIPSNLYDNMTLFIARTEAPGEPYQFYVKLPETPLDAQEVEVDSTEPGSLVPGLLSYQPFTKFFNYWDETIDGNWTDHWGTVYFGHQIHIGDGYPSIESEKSADFPRTEIDYDPTSVIYIPADNGRVDLMFQALTADGDVAYRLGRQAGYGQYDAVAWNTSADDPDATLTFLQCRTEQNITPNEKLNPCYDAYDNEMACFTLDDEGNIVTLETAGQDYGQLCLTLNATGKNLVEESNGKRFALDLIPDQDNVIAVQMRYLNGKTSDIVFLTVHPVSSAAPQGEVTVEPAQEGESDRMPYGTIVGKSGETTVRFTPAEGENTAGMRFWLCNGFYRYVDAPTQGISHGSGAMYWYNLDVRNPVEMIPQSDGSYLGIVPDYERLSYGWYGAEWLDSEHQAVDSAGLRHYVVVAEDAMGALWVLPSPMNSILTDTNGPSFDSDGAADASDGTYSVDFYVSEETLFACVGTSDYRSRSSSAPITLTFAYDEAYTDLAGTGSLTVVYDPAEAFEKGSVDYASGVTTVEYELPVAGNSLGITSIETMLTTRTENTYYALAMPDALVLTVNGAISQKLTTATDVVLTLKAEDMYGHNTVTWRDKESSEDDEPQTDPCEISVVLENAVGAAPHFVSAEYKLTGNTTDGWQSDRALYMHFSGPVQPVASWICPQPKGYEATWADGFPITRDGEWTISYYDLLDNLHTETITLTDVFGDYGIDIDFSTTDYTEDAIQITLTAEGNQETPHGDYMVFLPLPDDLTSFEDREYAPNSTTVPGDLMPATYTVEENGTYVVLRAPYNGGRMAGNYLNSQAVVDHVVVDRELYDFVWHTLGFSKHFTDVVFRQYFTDYTIIHIGNYVNGRPGETVNIFFSDNGRQYTVPLPDSRKGETDGEVIVSYETSRDTEPVGSGETSKTFRAGDDDSFSFTYYDAATDTEYEISGTLQEYGVTLVAPVEPPVDERAPEIGSVTVWKQLGSRFERAEAFRGDSDDAEIEDVFSVYVDDAHPGRCGWASGYDLVFSVSDDSAWKLLLCAAEPTALTFDDVSDPITGVALQGNNVLITPEVTGEFWIAAVDEHGYFSYIHLNADWFHFDTAAPVITASPAVATEFYERTIYLTAADDHTAAEGIVFTGEGIVANDDSNAAYPAADWPYMIVFTENVANVPVTATDAVGNSSIVYLTVEGIDTTKPTLTVTWSPCFAANGRLNENAPTDRPTNVDVVAHISSDKPLIGGYGTVRVTSPDYPDYEEIKELPYGPFDYFSYRRNPVYFEGSESLISVYFTDSYDYIDVDDDGYMNEWASLAYEVTLTLTALNNQEAEVVLNLGAGVVDIYEPWLYEVDHAPLYREKLDENGSVVGAYGVAYGYEVTMRFDEDTRITGGDFTADPSRLIARDEPFTARIYDNEDHPVTFEDVAGNVYTEYLAPRSPEPIDNEAPVLSIFNEDELVPIGSSQTATVKIRIAEYSDIDSITVSNPSAVTFDAAYADDPAHWLYDDAENEDYLILPLTVSKNGTYRLTVTDAAGNTAQLYFGVSNVDLTLPTIRFATPSVSLRAGSTAADLAALLEAGVTLWDNVDGESALRAALTIDTDGFTYNAAVYPAVNLSVPGIYEVLYTVTDSAGNVGAALRAVRVVSDKQPEILVDGRMTELNGTLSVRPGDHSLTVNLVISEPYTVKLVKGIWSEGQIKYVNVGVPVADDGSFTLSAGGFYTLYIVTQSRQTYRTLLYAEN